MRIIFLSDTHTHHDELTVPEGDMVVHAGDFSYRGLENEVAGFFEWFSALPHPFKVFIAGNHDFMAERAPDLFRSMLPANLIYLEDSGVEIAGIRIWGSPVQPWFFDWAFNRQRGPDIRKHWDLIPDDTDLLITHGPPFGILDRVVRDGKQVGCADLLEKVQAVQPRVHVFGHIHEAYGQVQREGTLYLNASVLDERYRLVNQAIVLDWK